MKNIFGVEVGSVAGNAVSTALQPGTNTEVTDVSVIIRYILLALFISASIGISYYLLLERKKRLGLEKSEERFWKNLK